MKVTGTATLHAPPPQVWSALRDPAVLARTIPGCDHLEVTGPGSIRLTATTAVASTNGTYTSNVSLTERQEPTSLRLEVEAAGAPGHISATVRVLLEHAAADSTEVAYDADAEPGGLIAAVGQRLLASTARKLADDFFTSVDEVLMSRVAAAPVGVERAPSTAQPLGVRAGGAAGVSSPAVAPTRGGSGMTREPPTEDRQPAGRPVARPHTRGFLQGVLVGAGIALGGMMVARLLGRRSRGRR